MIASVIGVGSELTSGQIMNKNGVWISKSLKDLGVSTSAHLVVPDDRQLILDALRFCADRCDTMFVTGGLGPTTDDFTRELISEWSKQPLEFDEDSWTHIKERLGKRGIEIREAQRQQCMYPKGAIVIKNPDGTANAFRLRVGEVDVIVLPGPPREIEACWNYGLGEFIAAKAVNIDKHVTYSWDTMGLGESDVSHMTEECLTGIVIEKGYRVHMPYVEVKLSFLESQKKEFMPFVEKVDAALHAITITRNGDDVAELLSSQLTAVDRLQIVDACTGNALLERLTPVLKSQLAEKPWSFSSEESQIADPLMVRMILKPHGTSSITAELHYRGASFKDVFDIPFFMAKLNDRRSRYFAERAMIFWNQSLARIV